MQFYNRSMGGAYEPFTANVQTNQLEMNLATWALSNGWDGTSAAEITIDTGVYVYSNNVATPALTTGVFPKGLKIIVNGYIIGMGGTGAGWNPLATIINAENGGTALKLQCNTTVYGGSGSYIAGGGGGGAGANNSATLGYSSGGGGAGGGPGGRIVASLGGSGGAPGGSGTVGNWQTSTGGIGTSYATRGTGGGAGGGGSTTSL